MQDQPGLWVLAVPNPEYREIGPSTPFKFRVDDGVWLDPPVSASNRDGGNLIFEPGLEPLRLRAELRGPRAIWIWLTGDQAPRWVDAADFRLTHAGGDAIPIDAIIPNTSTESLLVSRHRDRLASRLLSGGALVVAQGTLSARPLVPHTVLCQATRCRGPVTTDRRRISSVCPACRSSRALSVRRRGRSGRPGHPTNRDAARRDGVWEASVARQLARHVLRLYGPWTGRPGQLFLRDAPGPCQRPYARVSVDSFGKCRVWKRTDAGPSVGRRAARRWRTSSPTKSTCRTSRDCCRCRKRYGERFPAMVVAGICAIARGRPSASITW